MFLSILGGFWFQKPLQNDGSEGYFFDSLLICEKCDLERQYIKKTWFSNFEGSIFDLKIFFFSGFSEGAFKTYFLWILDRILVQIGSQMEPNIDRKSSQ